MDNLNYDNNKKNNESNIIKLDGDLNKDSTYKNCECDEVGSCKKEDSKKNIGKTQIWIKTPYILFDKNHILDIWPKETMTREEKFNAITRCVLFLTFIGFFVFKIMKILVTGLVTLVILAFIYYALNKKNNKELKEKLKEGFSDEVMYEKMKQNFTNPTTQNPIMNVLVPEIGDNPERLQAAPAYNKKVESQINDSVKNIVKKNFDDENIGEKLFEDLGDNMMFEQNMRQFYATPNTLVPNNQKDFARFCYGNTAACKDGDFESEQCNINSNSNL